MSNKKLTTEEFIKKAREVHGDKYDYSKVEYNGRHEKVCIVCPEHGEFWQDAASHLKGCGCPSCVGLKKLTKDEFVEKAIKTHGNKYDYSKVEYINNRTKVCIICPEHGEFWQTPHNHLNGANCPKCVGNKKLTTEEFIEKARKVHGDNFNYSKTEYINNQTKVCIICPEHGEFWQTPYNHLSGEGCPYCFGNKKLTTEEFIEKARKVHGDKYDYSKVSYISSHVPVTIICPEHGEFLQDPYSHTVGIGCPRCSSSKGEKLLRETFLDNSIEFVEQKTWNWLVYKGKQHVDFYLPKENLVIEYQGEQHFTEISFFSTRSLFDTQQYDQNKKRLCEEHGIRVIYFSNMTKVLGKEFKYPYDVIEDIDELIRIIKNLPD